MAISIKVKNLHNYIHATFIHKYASVVSTLNNSTNSRVTLVIEAYLTMKVLCWSHLIHHNVSLHSILHSITVFREKRLIWKYKTNTINTTRDFSLDGFISGLSSIAASREIASSTEWVTRQAQVMLLLCCFICSMLSALCKQLIQTYLSYSCKENPN